MEKQFKSGATAGSATGKNAASGKGGKTGKATQKKKPAAGTGAPKMIRSKPAASTKAGPSSGRKPAIGAASKEKPKDPPGKDTVKEGTPTSVTAQITAQVFSSADLAAAQEHNTVSSKARLQLADVLKESLEEASVAADQEGAANTNPDEAVVGTKTVEETKARLVELYNQVPALQKSFELMLSHIKQHRGQTTCSAVRVSATSDTGCAAVGH